MQNPDAVRRAARHVIESLERRQLMATFVVTNVADAGAGSLRQAILNANANVGADTINFQLPSNTGTTLNPIPAIAISTPLPAITDRITLDARTQPAPNVANAPFGRVMLGWVDRRAAVAQTGLTLSGAGASNSVIRGFRFEHWLVGIDIGQGVNGVRVTGNEFAAPHANSVYRWDYNEIGVSVKGNAATIGGALAGEENVFYFNGTGVELYGNDATVRRAHFGESGSAGAQWRGLRVGVWVRGNGAAVRDSRFGDVGTGIVVDTGSAFVIEGNVFGASVTGGDNNPIETAIRLQAATGGTIGGTLAAARNVFEGVGIETGSTATAVIAANGGNTIIRGNDFVGNAGKSIQNLFGTISPVPVLTAVSNSGSNTLVTGQINGIAGQTYDVDFYLSEDVHPRGEGDGAYVASLRVVASSSGLATFTAQLPGTLDSSDVVSAAATPLGYGRTSDLSAPIGLTYQLIPPAVRGTVTEPGPIGDPRPASGVRVWADLDQDGVRDTGEPTAVSDALGAYALRLPAAGTYTLRVDPSGTLFVTTGTRTVAVSSTAVVSGQDFNVSRPATVTGVMYLDENRNGQRDTGEQPLSGIVVSLDVGTTGAAAKSTTTAADGSYTFAGLAPGSHSVSYWNLPDNLISPRGSGYTPEELFSVASNGSATRDLPIVFKRGNLGGRVFTDFNSNGILDEGEVAVAGITAWADLDNDGVRDATEPSGVTNAGGVFYFDGEVDYKTIFVRVQLPAGWAYTGSQSIAVSALQLQKDVSVRPTTVGGVIAGSVWDVDRSFSDTTVRYGTAGHVVFLDADNDSVLDIGERSTTTDMNGMYAFTGLAAGTYVVRAKPANGLTLALPLDQAAVVVALGTSEVKLRQSFAFIDDPEGIVRGTVFNDVDRDTVRDAGELPLAGVRVFIDANENAVFDLGEASTLSDAFGAYAFTQLSADPCVVRAIAPAGMTSTRTGTNGGLVVKTPVGGGTVLGNDLGFVTAAVASASISGVVWAESDGDGVREIGQPGESLGVGKTVFVDANANGKLDAGERSVVSDSKGVYTFTNLAAGQYRITRVLPAGYRLSNPIAGYHLITLSGINVTNADIGSTDKPLSPPPPPPPPPPASVGVISGYAFNDSNKNGKLDASESKASGKTVFVDANNNGKLDAGELNVVTDSSGGFRFGTLAAGLYRIRRVFPAGYTYSTPLLNINLTAGQTFSTATIGSRTIA